MRYGSAVAAVGLAVAMAGWAAAGPAEKKGDASVKEDIVQKITAALPEKAPAKPAKPRRMLILTLTKGFRHGSIPLAAKALELLGQKTKAYETVISDDITLLKPESLAKFDAVCSDQCTGNLTENLPDADALKASILEFVKSGRGLVGVHAATDCGGWKFPEFNEMIGGVFAGHPFRKISVKLDDPASPVNAVFGKKGFEISDEIYTFKEAYSRDKLRILLSVDWENTKNQKGANRDDNDYALSWIKEYGKGRVFYCAFGHDDAIWWKPEILAHYLAGIQYAFGDLKADATPSAKVKLEPARGPVAQ
jgi:type 1 glutamine amidotransferase